MTLHALPPRCRARARLGGGLLALTLAALAIPAGAAPDERRVGLDDQTGVAVTIYNEDLALVRDRRQVALDA